MGEGATQWNLEELQLLFGISQMLLQDRDYGELLAAILDATIEGLGAESGFVLVHENGAFRIVVARNYRSEDLAQAKGEFSTSIANDVLHSGKALLLGDAASSESFKGFSSVRNLALRSVLCAPLVNSNEVFAVIYLENRKFTNFFTERKRELLDGISMLAAPRIRTAVAMQDAKRRAADVRTLLGDTDGIITADGVMAAVLDTVHRVAPTDLPVLIQGETGSGKELVARALYRHSNRAKGPFVILNCAALPATLIESELFGYVRGAFTGANRDRVGVVGAAHLGTLFLDEIGELPLELQPRLLRVLQSGEFNRVGSVQTEIADVRFIAATNRDLKIEVDEGRFRSDLYFRLSPITVKVPPLRSRPHDLHLLAQHFLEAYSRRFGREAPRLSNEALAVLAAYPFPGNIRELEGEMARLVAMCPPGTVIRPDDLSENVRGVEKPTKNGEFQVPPMPLAVMERQLIRSVLESTGGNRSRAAEILGITREGLRNKMQRMGLDAPNAKAGSPSQDN